VLTGVTMYTYIMQRTQIYLGERETDALDVAVRATGKTRSHLIREAIAERYGATTDATAIEARLRETAGAWAARRQSGQAAVERLRKGRLSRLHEGPTGEPSKS
jgi:Arc/MetJ-type ribon-helix-helix transcriptional regulator